MECGTGLKAACRLKQKERYEKSGMERNWEKIMGGPRKKVTFPMTRIESPSFD
jgi:hypothetical protein